MTAKAALHQAIVAAFQAEDGNVEIASAALTNMLCAITNVAQEPVLAELRKQTTLLEVIAKQGEFQLEYISGASDPLHVAAAPGGLPG